MASAIHLFAAVVIAMIPLGERPLGRFLQTRGMYLQGAALDVMASGRMAGAGIPGRFIVLQTGARGEGRGGVADEVNPRESVGRFLTTVKKAIPWAAALALVAALGVVVVTCWLRKGVLLQNLAVGRGGGASRKGRDHSKAAAKYVAKLEERRAVKQDEKPDR